MGAELTGKDKSIALVREFNRFYTQQIGVLQESLLASQFSLTEARVLYELSLNAPCTGAEIANLLGINRGYLSRILRRFQSTGFLGSRRSSSDGRQLLLTLTNKGKRTYTVLDARADAQIGTLLKDLSQDDKRQLLNAMRTIRRLLSKNGS